MIIANLYGTEAVLSKPAAFLLNIRPFPLEQVHHDVSTRLAVIRPYVRLTF